MGFKLPKVGNAPQRGTGNSRTGSNRGKNGQRTSALGSGKGIEAWGSGGVALPSPPRECLLHNLQRLAQWPVESRVCPVPLARSLFCYRPPAARRPRCRSRWSCWRMGVAALRILQYPQHIIIVRSRAEWIPAVHSPETATRCGLPTPSPENPQPQVLCCTALHCIALYERALGPHQAKPLGIPPGPHSHLSFGSVYSFILCLSLVLHTTPPILGIATHPHTHTHTHTEIVAAVQT